MPAPVIADITVEPATVNPGQETLVAISASGSTIRRLQGRVTDDAGQVSAAVTVDLERISILSYELSVFLEDGTTPDPAAIVTPDPNDPSIFRVVV